MYDAILLASSFAFLEFFIPTPLSLSNNASSTIGPKNSCKYSSVNSPFILVSVFLNALFLTNLSNTFEVNLFVDFPNALLPYTLSKPPSAFSIAISSVPETIPYFVACSSVAPSFFASLYALPP